MKTIEELSSLRDQMKNTIGIRNDDQADIHVRVGMATCGIAAGARSVVTAFMQGIEKHHLNNAAITQMGCIGICQYEPIVEVTMPGQEKVTYVKMTPEKAARVVEEHLCGGKAVTEFTLGAN